MRIQLDYDRDGIEIEVPEQCRLHVLEKTSTPGGTPEGHALGATLAEPSGTPRLSVLAKEARNACVVIPDVTRPLPLKSVLPPLLAELEAGGIARDNILLLIATGLHGPNEGETLVEMLGPELTATCHVANHDATKPDEHADLGMTTNGVRALVDQRLVEVDLRITVGLVEPHFMAGFSGGRKMVCPGVCAEETIQGFHSYEILNSPKATNCCLDGNPVHRMSTEIAEMVGIHFTLNVVIDTARNLHSAHAGALQPAFEAACASARGLTTAPIEEPADIVVVSAGGYPLDTTWYQAIKGLVAAQAAVRPGGVIIQAAGLRDGAGSAAFSSLFEQMESLDQFMAAIATPGRYFTEQWELQMFARVAEKARVLLYSHNVPPETMARWFVESIPSVEEGLARALAALGGEASVLVMPHGPYLIPVPCDTL